MGLFRSVYLFNLLVLSCGCVCFLPSSRFLSSVTLRCGSYHLRVLLCCLVVIISCDLVVVILVVFGVLLFAVFVLCSVILLNALPLLSNHSIVCRAWLMTLLLFF